MSWDDDDEPCDEEGCDSGTTAPCPHCRAEIYDDAERCPRCGMYLSVEDSPREPWPAWMRIAVVLALIVCAMLAGAFSLPWLFR